MNRTILLPASLLLMFSCADYDLLDDETAFPAVELSVKSVRDSTITLSWTQCREENFKNYTIYYDSTDVVDQSDKLVDSLSFAQDTVKAVGNLAPATKYWFRVVLTSQSAKTTPSNTVSAITWLTFKPVQWQGDSAVTLAWTRVRNAPVNGYRIFSDTVGQVDSTDSLWVRALETDSSITIADLPAGATRLFRVFALGDSGYLALSSTAQVKGWAFTQYAPEKETDTSAIVRCSKPNASVTGYKVFYATSSPVDTADSIKATVQAVDTSCVIGNLAKGATHIFKVYATGGNGYVAWTREKTFRVE
jgi:hypothetical protein